MYKLNFKKLDFRGKIIAIFAAVIAATILILAFIVLPAVKNIKKMKADIEFQRLDLEKKYVKSQRLKKMALSLGKIENEVNRLDNIFISEHRQLEFITILENVAQENGLDQEINLNMDTGEKKEFNTANLNMRVVGNYGGLVKYLKDLEDLEYYINITDLEMSAVPNEDGQYDLMIKALTYWR